MDTKNVEGQHITFFFISKIDDQTLAEYHIVSIFNSVSESVDKLHRRVCSVEWPSNRRITNKIKNAMTECKNFKTCVEKPTESNHYDYISYSETKFVQ